MQEAPFRHPFTLLLTGGTGSGKTEWVKRFIQCRAALISPKITRVLYCYGELNESVMQLQSTCETFNGVPTEEYLKSHAAKNNLLVVFDDLMLNIKAAFLDALFTKISHNANISVVFMTQHLFTKELRVARNNAHYVVLMRNAAGELQVRNFGAQIFPNKLPYFMEAYKDATKELFTYLMVDLHPSTPPHLRLKTRIYPDEMCIVYVPKDQS